MSAESRDVPADADADHLAPEAVANIRALCDAGDIDAAVEMTLSTYGAELLRFLIGAARDHGLADDAFSRFAVDMWRGLSTFHWKSSLRTWAYVVARRALGKAMRSERRQQRELPLPSAHLVEEIVARVKTTTAPHLRSEVKSKMAALRDRLGESDRTLLILRVDRNLGWREIAQVLAEDDLTAEQLDRSAAQLRKQFERLKARLRTLAIEAGVLER